MKHNTLQEAEEYTRYTNARRRKKRWQKIVTCLAAVVVFCTTYALILPAITLEKGQCEIPEHVHDESCYQQVNSTARTELICTLESLNIHRHTADCRDENGNYICGYADFAVHSHDASCYDADGNLRCPLPEIRVHRHDENCYAVPETSEQEVHVHSEECYTAAQGERICGEEETEGHTHGAECYGEDGALICQEEETEGHQHTDACYAWEKVLTCNLSTEPAETEPAEPVLVCSKEEIILHEHTADCFDGNGNLVCGKLQVLQHVHSDACFGETEEPADAMTLTCRIPESDEHQHSALCYGTWELICGMEEHTHSLMCYADPTADVETAAVWEKTLEDVTLTGEWRTDVLAIAQTQLDYRESTRNYVLREDGETTKGYTRYGDWYGDPYGDWCAMFVSFCIHYADVEEMPLDAGCRTWISALQQLELYHPAYSEDLDEQYDPAVGDLIFFDWEQDGLSDHVGLLAELIPETEEEPAKIKTIEGNSADRVQYVTYEADTPDILGYGSLPEQTFYCGKTGHVHTEACGGADQCGLEEHIHTDICKNEPEVASGLSELTFIGPDYTVLVRYGADAALPDGVTLAVSEIPPDSEEYRQYYEQSLAAIEAGTEEQTVIFARFFDIQFLLDGEKLEPAAPVSVTITYAETVETGADMNCRAVHFAEDGTEILDAATEAQEDGSTSFTHTQNGFSVVGDVVTVPAAYNAADNGPDKLAVDYYVCIDGEWVCVGSTKTGWYNNWNGTEGWTNYNRDYITVEQAVSILGPYGFTGNEENPSRVTAYQQKSGNTNIYSDTDTVIVSENAEDSQKILPLSRNDDHVGYNLYYLPNNSNPISTITSPDGLDKSANGFYTVKVFDAQGTLITSTIVKTGGSFSYDATESGVTNWLVAYSSGMTGTISNSSITLDNITSTVTVSPIQGDAGSHSVTFKVMIDGTWQTVGSLPYYYSGTVNGVQRAYITSDMAAQFFGDFGYAATTAPEYHFGYSYNDIYSLFYANGNTQTNFCMDVAGGTLAEGQTVQLYTSNSSDAQIFRIWDAGNGYSFITPIGNSNYHVNAYGYSSGDPSSTQLKLSTATNANSQWKVDTGSDGRTTFWSAIAPEDQVIDLNNANMSNGAVIQIWHSTGGARYWYMVQILRISNNTVSEKNADGTWKIGLTAESNGDIVCYYMSAETGSAYTNVSESAVSTANSFWSVSVRDDTHAVYSDGELSGMVQYVAAGGEATVTVENADGILWSCRGVNGQPVEVESTQSGGYTTFVMKNITQPIEVMATKANPSFTVQYYANIPRFATSGSNPLKVIDTSGKALPTNGGSMATKSLYLEATGNNTTQNAGDATQLYRIKTTTELTKMYSDKTYHYEESPGLTYFNKLKDNESYVLQEIWVLKSGMDAASTDRNDWDIYTYSSDTAFTNEASQAVGNTILINDGAVIRLVSDTSTGSYYNGTTFYDYNISSGKNSAGRWCTGITGINSSSNYGSSGNNERNWYSASDVFAFGNANCGTGMSGFRYEGGFLNKFNGKTILYKPNNGSEVVYGNNPDYGGANFGIAYKLNTDGTICYNEWIVAPKLFNDGDAYGKQTYSGSSLSFNRVGDTYTLSSATLRKQSGDTSTLSGLQYFFNPSPTNGTIYSHIFTNNFWPMDQADSSEKTDGLWGAYGNEGSFQGFYEKTPAVDFTNEYNLATNFPAGDDGRAHNWFFGMNFAISFNLTADYEGPLEYYFFGDDDLWVFLDTQLVCDIGGVHSSIGEYVNLRDYLPVGSAGQHTLTFFYTERGASGSTCYMSFTLPSVSSATTAQDTGSLNIQKTLEDTEDVDYSGEEYQFRVELLTAENGSALNQTFSYSRTDGTYGTIKSGGTIALHQNESITISGIPTGTFYRVTELSTEGYHTTVNGEEGYIVSGKIETGAVKPANFVNRPYQELPQTGGAGTIPYTIGGLALIAGAGMLLLYHHKRRRREFFSSS